MRKIIACEPFFLEVTMEADGPAGQVKRQAVCLSAASEMLWGYMQTGPKEFNASLKSWGWLVNSSIRAIRELVPIVEEYMVGLLLCS